MRRGFSLTEILIVFIIFCIIAAIAIPHERPMSAEERCRAMLAMARSSSDSLLVYAAKPDSRYSTCADRIIQRAPRD